MLGGVCQAAKPSMQIYIVRGNDKIVYSGSKQGLRVILLSFLKVKSKDVIRIHTELKSEAAVKGAQLNLTSKSRTHSFEVINGYYRFTVLPDEPEEKVYAITANKSFEGAIAEFVDSLYMITQ